MLNHKTLSTIVICLAAPIQALACTSPVATSTQLAVDLGNVTRGKVFTFSLIARATNYDGSNGGPVSMSAVATGPLQVSNPTFNVPFGSNQTGQIMVTATPTAAGPQTGTVTVNFACGDFPSPDPLKFNYTYTGLATAPPTSDGNPNTGKGGEPVSTGTGELYGHDERQLLTGFRTYYASYLFANTVTSALGPNWMHNFDVRAAVTATTAEVTRFRGKKISFTRSDNAWQLAGSERRPYQFLTVGSGFQFLDPDSNLVYGFDSSGKLTSAQDRNGNTVTVTQGANGPAGVDDGLGRTLTFTYTGTALTRAQDQSGRSVSFEYASGALAAITDPNGKRWSYAYASGGGLNTLMTAETRPAGNKPFTQTFDTQGRVATQSSSRSTTMTFAYSANGATFSEPGGVTLTHAHDTNLNLTSQTDPSGGSSQFTYDANKRLTSVVDRNAARSTIAYDSASGLASSYTDELGNITRFTYAAQTQNGFTYYVLTNLAFADGTSVQYTRDARGNVTAFTDAASRVWQLTRNARGQILTATNPAGGITTYVYGSNATLTSVQDAFGNTTRFGYDAALRPNLMTNPDNTTQTYQYDGMDALKRFTDERSNSIATEFDDNHNLRSVTDALGGAITFAYDTDDEPAIITDAVGKAVRRTRDSIGRLQKLTYAAGDSVTFAYDALNRPVSMMDGASKGFTFTWDREARLASSTDALSRTTTYSRDARGRLLGITTPANEKYSLTRDKLGRVTSAADPLGRTTQLTYDGRGSLTGIALPGGVTDTLARNELGLITAVTDPNGNVWQQTFDKAGRPASEVDPLKRTTAYEYDSRNRLTQETLPEGTVQYSYDAAGNPTQVQAAGTTLNYTWDANRRLTGGSGLALSYDANGRITSSNGLTSARDDNGRIASIAYASGKAVRYTYDARGLLTRVSDWVGGNTDFTYDDARQRTSMTLPNGVREDYTYDANGRVLTIKTARGGTAISAITLKRDALGRVTSADRSAPNVPDLPTGNRSNFFDAAHQSFAGIHDSRGRMTSTPARNFVWDGASRLASIIGDGAATFTYDALGMRTGRSAGGTNQSYVINYALGLPSVSVVRSGSTDQNYYVWLPNGMLLASIASDGARRFYHFDESGTTNYLTNDAGVVTDTYAVAPYGETILRTGATDNPFTFHGATGVMQEGTTGLFYMRARYYDSGSARFLSPDPVSSVDPRMANPYQFAFGNPVERGDPRGTEPDDRSAGTVIPYQWTPDLPHSAEQPSRSKPEPISYDEYVFLAFLIYFTGDTISLEGATYSGAPKYTKVLKSDAEEFSNNGFSDPVRELSNGFLAFPMYSNNLALSPPASDGNPSTKPVSTRPVPLSHPVFPKHKMSWEEYVEGAKNSVLNIVEQSLILSNPHVLDVM